jgi:hypothetical protein
MAEGKVIDLDRMAEVSRRHSRYKRTHRYGGDIVAPPGNQAETENTNINLEAASQVIFEDLNGTLEV